MVLAFINLLIFIHLLFLLAVKIKNNGIVDIGWGIGFIIIDISLLVSSTSYNWPQLIISSLIIFWALRLSLHILRRSIGKPEDFRYANWRKNWGKSVIWRSYLQVFLLQMVFLLVIAIPMFLVWGTQQNFSHINLIGCLIAFLGLAIESISDYQMFLFKQSIANKGLIMQSGLWRYSRHPNYFGEALFWWGIAFIAYAPGNHFLAFISPIVITILVRYISGVPMLEEKYKNNIEFDIYKSKTSPFILWFPKK
jgi:steroid 5-alpha reductase family enzyme